MKIRFVKIWLRNKHQTLAIQNVFDFVLIETFGFGDATPRCIVQQCRYALDVEFGAKSVVRALPIVSINQNQCEVGRWILFKVLWDVAFDYVERLIAVRTPTIRLASSTEWTDRICIDRGRKERDAFAGISLERGDMSAILVDSFNCGFAHHGQANDQNGRRYEQMGVWMDLRTCIKLMNRSKETKSKRTQSRQWVASDCRKWLVRWYKPVYLALVYIVDRKQITKAPTLKLIAAIALNAF